MGPDVLGYLTNTLTLSRAYPAARRPGGGGRRHGVVGGRHQDGPGRALPRGGPGHHPVARQPDIPPRRRRHPRAQLHAAGALVQGARPGGAAAAPARAHVPERAARNRHAVRRGARFIRHAGCDRHYDTRLGCMVSSQASEGGGASRGELSARGRGQPGSPGLRKRLPPVRLLGLRSAVAGILTLRPYTYSPICPNLYALT